MKDRKELDFIVQFYETGKALAKTNAGEIIPEIEHDILPIVYCEDCINNTRNVDGVNENWCLHFGHEVEEDDFCSRGER